MFHIYGMSGMLFIHIRRVYLGCGHMKKGHFRIEIVKNYVKISECNTFI